MANDKLDIPDWLLDTPDVTDTVDERNERRLAIPMILGTIRWDGALGRPRGLMDQAFEMFVERVDVTPLEEVDPRKPQPYACNVTFRDASDKEGPCVSFMVRGLSLVGFDSFPRNPHGREMNGGYILTPSIKVLWGDTRGARPFLGRLEFTPAKFRTPLTENAPMAEVHFILAPR